MPRFNAKLGDTSIGFTLLPKDDYEFELSAPRLINRTNDNGPVYGVLYIATVTKGPDGTVGKKVPYSLYLHSDAAASMVKRFAMAALGFTLNEEGETLYDTEYGDMDSFVDTDEGVDEPMGELWHKVGGSVIAASVDQKPTKKDKDKLQNEFYWKAVGV